MDPHELTVFAKEGLTTAPEQGKWKLNHKQLDTTVKRHMAVYSAKGAYTIVDGTRIPPCKPALPGLGTRGFFPPRPHCKS